MLRHSRYCRVSEGAQYYAIDPALEVVSDVAKLFARVDARGGLVDKERVSAHAGDTSLESKPRSQRGLFEEHH